MLAKLLLMQALLLMGLMGCEDHGVGGSAWQGMGAMVEIDGARSQQNKADASEEVPRPVAIIQLRPEIPEGGQETTLECGP